MGWTSVRGRPRDFPRDRTPLRGKAVNALTRIAWLVRINRIAGPHTSTHAFTEALADYGCRKGATAISRYETGNAPIPAEVVVAYERALDLPEGQLLGACLGIHRMFGPALATDRLRPHESRADRSTLLRALESRVEDGSVTGMDWLALTESMCHPAGIVLPPSVRRRWTALLVSQTMRSIGPAYTTRMQALSRMVGDPQTRSTVFEQIGRAVDRPGAQGVIDVLAVLGDTTDPMILRWLIEHLAQDHGPRQQGVAKALLTPVVRGTFPGELVPALTHAIRTAAHGGGLPAFWLAQRISLTLTQEVVDTLGSYPAPVDKGARIQSPAHLGSYLDAAGQISGLLDPMLERLLREALSPDFIERRHHALLLLAASPYRQVLAEVAVNRLSDKHTRYAADAAATALTYLAGPGQRDRLVSGLDSGAIELPGQTLIALAHSGGAPADLDLLGRAADPGQSMEAAYAAGMSDHPDLLRIATSSHLAGSCAQTAARWWQQVGPAVIDRPHGPLQG